MKLYLYEEPKPGRIQTSVLWCWMGEPDTPWYLHKALVTSSYEEQRENSISQRMELFNVRREFEERVLRRMVSSYTSDEIDGFETLKECPEWLTQLTRALAHA